jgi:hypothetical protein
LEQHRSLSHQATCSLLGLWNQRTPKLSYWETQFPPEHHQHPKWSTITNELESHSEAGLASGAVRDCAGKPNRLVIGDHRRNTAVSRQPDHCPVPHFQCVRSSSRRVGGPISDGEGRSIPEEISIWTSVDMTLQPTWSGEETRCSTVTQFGPAMGDLAVDFTGYHRVLHIRRLCFHRASSARQDKRRWTRRAGCRCP